MATATAPALTDAYRRAQGRAATRAASLTAVAFDNVLDVAALDSSFPAFVSVVAPVINGARQETATIAAGYYETHRIASGVTGQAPAIAFPGVLNLAQLTASLLFAGPVTVKQQLANGNGIDVSLAVARAVMSRVVFRHTANAGRGTIYSTAQRDRRAEGYARVTDGKPCAFCAMLCSRGAVYKSDPSDGGRGSAHRYHDGCGCTIQPVYSHDAEIPGDGAKYAELWESSTRNLKPGDTQAKAFRRAYDASL